MNPYLVAVHDWRELNAHCPPEGVLLFQIFDTAPSEEFRSTLLEIVEGQAGFKYIEISLEPAAKLFTKYDRPSRLPIAGAWVGGNITNYAASVDLIPNLIEGALRLRETFAQSKRMREEEERGT